MIEEREQQILPAAILAAENLAYAQAGQIHPAVEAAIRADERAKTIEECAKVVDSYIARADAKFDGVIRSARRGQKNMELAAAASAGMAHDSRKIAAAIRALGTEQEQKP